GLRTRSLDDLTAAEPLLLAGIILLPQGAAMKLTAIAFATATIVLGLANTFAFAQGAPSGRGSTTGDPAASSATPGTSPTTGSSTKSPSGSGTSTSGGSDANADQGRDKMPDSGQRQRPNDPPKQR